MTEPAIVSLDILSIISRYDSSGRLSQYFDLLMKENVAVNLVSRETTQGDFDRMVAESLVPLDFLPESFGSYLDIGAGGGIPAIPILLSGRVAGPAWIVERTQKKVTAMRRIIDTLGLQAELFAKTYEEIKLSRRFELITLRYVKLTPQLLNRILPALAPGGQFVYYSKPEFQTSSAAISQHSYVVSADNFVKHLTVFRSNS